jgi:hypothetical protein
VIASALSTWADRFRQGAGTVGDQSATLGKDAARLARRATRFSHLWHRHTRARHTLHYVVTAGRRDRSLASAISAVDPAISKVPHDVNK